MKYEFKIRLYPKRSDENDEVRESIPTQSMARWVAADWNDENMIQYFDETESYKLTSLSARANENHVIISAITELNLSLEEIDVLKDSINGQCSDGWGEVLEQIEYSNGESRFKYYISTWKYDEKENIVYLGCGNE